jgi:hypothetical protein
MKSRLNLRSLRWLTITVFACASPRPAPSHPDRAAPPAPDAATASAVVLLGAAHGDELLSLAATIPRELRQPVAFYLLRTQQDRCEDNGCGPRPVVSMTTLTSACTRERVIATLLNDPSSDAGNDATRAAVPPDILRAVTRASDDVIAAISPRLPNDQLADLLAELERSSASFGGWRSLGGRSADDAAAIFRRRRVAAAIPQLDPTRHADLLVATAKDGSSNPGLRAAAARRLREAPSIDRTHAEQLRAMFETLLADPDCDLAAAAIEGLRWLGASSVLPVAPHTTDAAVLLRAVCVLAKTNVGDGGYEADLYRTYIGPAGITVEDSLSEHGPSVDHVSGDAQLHLVRDVLSDTTCHGAVCTLAGANTRTTIELGKDPTGRLWVTKLVRSRVPDDCHDKRPR